MGKNDGVLAFFIVTAVKIYIGGYLEKAVQCVTLYGTVGTQNKYIIILVLTYRHCWKEERNHVTVKIED